MPSESLVSSLFSWVDAGGAQQRLDVDVTMSAEDSRDAKLSDHVVSSGSTVTDHVVLMPEKLSLELLVTNTPHLPSEGGFSQQPLTIASTARNLSPVEHDLDVRDSQFKPGGYLLLTRGVREVVSAVADATLGALDIGAAGVGAVKLWGNETQDINLSAEASTLQPDADVDRVGNAHDRLDEIWRQALLVTISVKGKTYENYLIKSFSLTWSPGKYSTASFSVSLRAFRTVTGREVDLPAPADFRALPKNKKGNKKASGSSDREKEKMRSILLKNGQNVGLLDP